MTNRLFPHISPRVNTIYNSPFEKMKKTNQKIKVGNEGNPLKQIKNFNNGQIHNSLFHFDVNLYFGNPKSSFTPIHPNEKFLYPFHNEQNQNIPVCVLFKTSLEKSGYKLTQEQTVQYKDINKKSNSIYSFYDDFNCYYFPMREFPMNNNNNIVNNIYPTFTKVTNVQIIPDNDKKNNNNTNKNFVNNKNKNNNNYNDIENKKENINENNIDKKNIIKEIKKNVNNNVNVSLNENNENKKQKVIFECSESNGSISPKSNKIMLKKKRLRKNNEQLGFLSKFYKENKIWSKKQIKEISQSIGLKENKIYKWLWDQKNKEYKVTKFVVNKDKDKNE